MTPLSSLGNLIRGMLIGVAEVIPGVSGGTVALIVGVYDVIIQGIADFVRALGLLVKGDLGSAKAGFKEIKFAILLPILLGMLLAIFTIAALIEPLITDYPEITRAAFAGMLVVSLAVPFALVRKSMKVIHWLLVPVAAALAFWLVTLPSAVIENPSSVQVVIFAAIAVCALVLPGVSGSFFLVAVGLYAPTIAAVNDRDFGYLGLFVLGAIIGLFTFASFMRWLLVKYRVVTLSAMIGLMIGSLAALWPWQSETGQLQEVESPAGTIIGFLLGGLAVTSIMLVERSRKLKH